MDKFYRWVWEQEGGYTAQITHEHANEWMKHLADEEYSNADRDSPLRTLPGRPLSNQTLPSESPVSTTLSFGRS